MNISPSKKTMEWMVLFSKALLFPVSKIDKNRFPINIKNTRVKKKNNLLNEIENLGILKMSEYVPDTKPQEFLTDGSLQILKSLDYNL